MFQKFFPAISHDNFSDQKEGCTISHNPLSIKIEKQSVLHEHFPYQKNSRAILHDHFSDQKESHAIFHNLKLISGIDFFVRQGRGVLNTPYMYLNF